jgi:arsenate reductase (glutaredoxin)
VEIWVNPACSKCRAATAALDEAGIAYTVRRYLEDPPTRAELVEVLARLDLEPWHITRTQEPAAAEAGLAAHPSLIQRPILTADDGTTVVGRDPAELGRVIDAEHR